MTDPWPNRLAQNSPDQEKALEELRDILMGGLRAGLSGKAKTDQAFLEDITQMALLKILASLDTFQGRSKFISWALSIAMRVAYNEIRRKSWKQVSLQELQEKQGDMPEEADASLTPAERYEQDARMKFVHECIEEYCTERQASVLQYELSGMPQEEIARQLGITRNNLYKLFHDSRRALKRGLLERGFDLQTFYGNQP